MDNANETEDDINQAIDPIVWRNMHAYVTAQDMHRGNWKRLRGEDMPKPPFPAPDNSMLDYLLERAKATLKLRGSDSALLWLATHAWMEGHIEGYDSAASTNSRS